MQQRMALAVASDGGVVARFGNWQRAEGAFPPAERTLFSPSVLLDSKAGLQGIHAPFISADGLSLPLADSARLSASTIREEGDGK